MALTLDDLYASPDHYLHSFEGDSAVFVPMDREAYRRSIFLDGRIQPGRVFDRTGPLDEVPDGYRLMNEREVLKFQIAF